jgi:hypothetical protein
MSHSGGFSPCRCAFDPSLVHADSVWHRDSCVSPTFFNFTVYQCSTLELLIYNLSISKHHSIKRNLTLKPIRLLGYFLGYALVYEPRHSQIRICCPYAAHHIDTVCLMFLNLFGYVCSWEIFLQMGRVMVYWDVIPHNLVRRWGICCAMSSLSTVSISFNYHSCG